MNDTLHDLRPLAPAQRHQLAFHCFDALAEGQAFDLVNDHEPRGLLMQFHTLHPQAFNWQVVQADPGYWRIRVGRVAPGQGTAPAPAARQGCGCGGGGGCS